MNISKLNYLKIIGLFSASIVPLLVLGPFFPDLILSTLSLWFIYFSIKNKVYYIFNNIYFYLFLAFCSICLISSLLAENVLLSFESSLFYFRIGIFALLISYLIEKEKIILDYFYYSFIITYSAIVVDGLFQYLTGSNLLGYELRGERVSSFFNEELIMGSYLVRLLPLFLALYLVRNKKNIFENILFYFLFTLSYLLIFLSGERTSFFFLNLFVFFNILLLNKDKFIRITIFVISIILVTSLILSDSKYYNRYIISPINQFGFDNANKEIKIFSPQHDAIYKTAWKMFLDKPILGHGPKMYRIKCKEKKYSIGVSPCDSHPHNFYIQLLAETGLVGFLFLFSLFCYLIFLIFKHLYKKIITKELFFSDYQICLISGLLISLWPLSPNGSFFNNYLMILYSLQIGFFSANKKFNLKI